MTPLSVLDLAPVPEGQEPAAPEGWREGYLRFLTRRLEAAPAFLEEALDARAQLV